MFKRQIDAIIFPYKFSLYLYAFKRKTNESSRIERESKSVLKFKVVFALRIYILVLYIQYTSTCIQRNTADLLFFPLFWYSLSQRIYYYYYCFDICRTYVYI